MPQVPIKTQLIDRSELERFLPRQAFRLIKFFENLQSDVTATIPNAISQSVQGPDGGAVDDNVVVFDGTTGFSVKDSGVSIDDLATLESPSFTGVPTTPTPPPGDASNQIANTAFVQSETANSVEGPGSATDDAIALFDGTSGKLLQDSGVLLSSLATNASVAATYAPLASPALTGNPTAPTASLGDNDTSIATTAFVQSAVAAATGRLLGVQTFLATAIYTPTAGTTRVLVKGQGSGGAGGGSAATAAGQVSIGGGGGAGGIGETLLTAGFSGVTVTIGAGGLGVAGAAGNNGGPTTFGAVLSLPGGAGGATGAAAAATVALGGNGGIATLGNVFNTNGAPGSSAGAAFAAGISLSGAGADSLYGGGGRCQPAGGGAAAGEAATGRSAGGSGALSMGVAAAAAGGAGANGIVIVYEYS